MNKKKLWEIFVSTFYLSAFTFGGGYVIITLLKNKFVDELHWIDEKEMLDLVAIAQSSPGAIAINGAIVVGYKLAGPVGILCAVIGAVLPPLLILTVISCFYNIFVENEIIRAMLSGMTAGIGAVILSVVWDMGSSIVKSRDWILILVMAVSFAADYILKINVVYLILAAALTGIIRTLYRNRKKGGIK